MTTNSLRSDVIAIANQQADLNDDELLELLKYEWERAGIAIADRGPGDYLRNVRDEILDIIIHNKETVTVINAMVADDTLRWAAQHHLASEQYAFVVGLLVAWITRAALRRSSESAAKDNENDHGS